MTTLGVGVIGASPLRPGWAVISHLPAIKATDGLSLKAVATSSKESARAAEAAYGVPGFFEARALIDRADVDLVVVAVKVPQHHDLVAMALDAGKIVMCEWPLGLDLEETRRLSHLAERSGKATLIGLQSRAAPAIRYARALIADGYVGDVLATTLVGSGIAWGGITDEAHAYLYDRINGATTMSVPLMHALDAMTFVLGDVAEVRSMSATRRSFVELADTNVIRAVTAPDHVAVGATLRSGVLASVFYRGGISRGDNFRWEINGTEGDLVLTSSVGNLQVLNPVLSGARGDESTVRELTVPPEYELAANAPPGPAANVARLYAAFLGGLGHGDVDGSAPDFLHAERQHAWLDAIEKSSRLHGLRAGID